MANPERGGRRIAIPLVFLGLAALAWWNALGAPFVFDDRRMIVNNPSIRTWALLVPARSPMNTRPVPRLTLAANYALGGLDVRGYHVVNVGLHVLAALVLLGVVRRTLAGLPSFAAASGSLALAVAAIWLVHPLQTEAVTYVSQRTEVLMGLFYLLTLYAGLRAWDSPHPRRWEAASVVACALGMASKEIMVTAPVMVVLYDRVFRCPSLAEAWRRRARLYAGLAAAWGVWVGLWLLSPPNLPVQLAAQTVAAQPPVTTAWQHLGVQLDAVARYLGLAVWPTSLCLDYGVEIDRAAGEVVRGGIVVVTLVAGTAWALFRKPALGFLGAWFLLILAPTTSVVLVVSELMAERRMYLPLAAVVAAIVLGGWLAVGWAMRGQTDAQRASVRWAMALVIVATLTALTVDRNADYRSPVSIWADAVEKRPSNARAHNNLGNELMREERVDEALPQYAEAIRIEPAYGEAHYNLGNAFVRKGLPAEAAASWAEAIRVNPRLVDAHYNLGNLDLQAGRFEQAIARYTEALRIAPQFESARRNLVLAQQGLAAPSQHGD